MLRLVSLASILFSAAAFAGCPDREAVTDQVGGAAGRQVQEVQMKVDRVEGKLEDMANKADAVAE